MKKICRTVKLRKFKTEANADILDNSEYKSYFILYDDGKYEFVWDTYEVEKALRNDHIRPIRYIFDNSDKIMVDRDIIINTDDLK